jgi:hypothetical protein
MRFHRIATAVLAVLLVWQALAASPRDRGNRSRRMDSDTGEFSRFNLIAERNIFNPDRAGRSSRPRAEERRARRVDTISLVGTLSYEKGPFAFFDGSDRDYQKVLPPGNEIAGFRIADINGHTVKLESGTNTITLTVGMQLRREEDQDWQVVGGDAAGPESSASNAASGASSASSESEENDIVKRMMQQREQELK